MKPLSSTGSDDRGAALIASTRRALFPGVFTRPETSQIANKQGHSSRIKDGRAQHPPRKTRSSEARLARLHEQWCRHCDLEECRCGSRAAGTFDTPLSTRPDRPALGDGDGLGARAPGPSAAVEARDLPEQ